jgi:exopolysaccharide production protein ExoZ
LGSQRLLGVQYLRAIAAAAVVAFHALDHAPIASKGIWLLQNLQPGVQVFFAISGFVMVLISSTVQMTPGLFLTRRLIRIVPLYWLLTVTLVVAKRAHFFKTLIVTPTFVLKSLLFIPYADPQGLVAPLLLPGWMLNVEMFFYCTFACVLLLAPQRRLVAVAAIYSALVGVGVLLPDVQHAPALWIFTRPWMWDFVLGMGIGQLYLTDRLRLPRMLCVLLCAGGTGCLLSGSLPAAADISSAAIALGVIAWDRSYGVPLRPLLKLLGDASYSIYLSHIFTVATVLALLRYTVLAPYSPLLAIPLSLAAGVAVYWLLERPMRRGLYALLQSFGARARRADSMVAAARAA